MPLHACVPATATSGQTIDDTPGLTSSDPPPVDVPAVGQVEIIHLSSPPMSGQLSPGSPRTEMGDSSVPLSPNRVFLFLMRPSGAAGQHPEAGVLLPSALDGSNLQILSQFVTSLHRMSSEMLSIGMGWVVFPAEEIADLSPVPRATRAATYMAAMGLWRPQTGPGDPRPVPASSCNACMNCRYCFPEGRLPPE